MSQQSSRMGRVWNFIGGFVGLVAIIGVVIAYFQWQQADKASRASDDVQATMVAVMNDQLAVQKEIASAQALPAKSKPTITAIAAQVAMLASTQETLDMERKNIEATQTSIAQGRSFEGTVRDVLHISPLQVSPSPAQERSDAVNQPSPIPTLQILPSPTIGTNSSYVQEAELPLCPQSLAFGQTIACSIDEVEEIDTYTFEAKTDDQILIRAYRISETMQPWIIVLAPDKSQICGYDNWSDRTIDVGCSIKRSGLYTIQIADHNKKEVGKYTLYLQRLKAPGGQTKVNFGQYIKGEINRPTKIDTFTFDAKSDDKLFIRILRTTETLQPFIGIYNPDGFQICYEGGSKYIEMNCTVPKSGVYTILVSDKDARTGIARTGIGDYMLYVQRLNNPGDTITIASGRTLKGSINFAIKVDTYVFEGKADEKVTFKMIRNSETVQPWIRVFDPNGAEFCQAHGERQAQADCQLPRSGRYVVLVADFSNEKTEVGDYSLSMKYPQTQP